jgi:hypothetical protein
MAHTEAYMYNIPGLLVLIDFEKAYLQSFEILWLWGEFSSMDKKFKNIF